MYDYKMAIRTEQFVVSSINRTQDNTFSYANGNPRIDFQLSAVNKMLDTSSLRLCFKVRVEMGDGSAPNNNTANSGAALSQATISANNGASSLISMVSLTTSSGAAIETIRNYPRLVASVLQATNSWYDYTTNLQHLHGATGNDLEQARWCNLNSGDATSLGAGGVMEGTNAYSFSVAMPLLCGFLMKGDNINLSNRGGIGGLSINLTLSPDVFSVFGEQAATVGGSKVLLIDPVLTGKYVIPNDDEQLPDTGTIVYNSWTSLYSVNQQSDDTFGYNTGLAACVSQFSNNIPVEFINNYGENSSATPTLLRKNGAGAFVWRAPITSTTYLKSGVFLPNDFVVDEFALSAVAGDATTSNVFKDIAFDAQRMWYYLDSIKPYRRTRHLLANGITENVQNGQEWDGYYNYQNPADYELAGTQATIKTRGNVFGVGCRYDGLGTGRGSVNLKDSQFSERLTSKLDGTSSNGLYSFFLHQAAVNFSPAGVSVSV